jgi:adenine/guanine phosphoribosyltransferase-like PRPP-binding protein
MTIIDWEALFPPYLADLRGGKLKEFKVHPKGEGEFLLLCGPVQAFDQLRSAAGSICVAAKLTENAKKTYTHALYFVGGVPTVIVDLAERLRVCLSIPAPAHVDHALALDWYNQPDGEGDIAKTGAGYWIYTTKYATHPQWGTSRQSRREMIAALVEFVHGHPLFGSATAIVTAPGHDADGQSFGEILGREVAQKAGIPFVESTSPGPRPAQKETQQDLTDTFTVNGVLSGTVIVLDDVYHAGGSASGAAAAARRAGAETVLSLVVARTIRK